MKYEQLRTDAWRANRDIVEAGLVALTWGNASAADRAAGVMAIKPSGIDYTSMTPADMVVLSLETGAVVDGGLRPSTDAPTHRHLYQHFSQLGAVVHTHSANAVAWAQAHRALPCFGTTHADYFNGAVPVTRTMHPDEIGAHYERNTGAVIVACFREASIDPMRIPAVLVAGHGPFAWGPDVAAAVENAIVLELVAGLALDTLRLNASTDSLDRALADRHFERKHGDDAYYGQR